MEVSLLIKLKKKNRDRKVSRMKFMVVKILL